MRLTVHCVGVACVALAATSASAANLIVDGSFEDNASGAFLNGTKIGGVWDVSNDPLGAWISIGDGALFGLPQDGVNYLYVSNNQMAGSVSQSQHLDAGTYA